MPLSVNVSTGLVKGRFGSGVVAGPNGEKLLVPARGRIDFEPVAPYVPYPTGTPSAFTILRKVITGILDSEGYLCTPHPDYPDVPGVRGLELYSPDDPQAGVQGWTWRGTPRFVNADGTRLHNTMEPFTFDLPYGEEVDLVNVVDMPQSPGIGKEQAIILAASAQAAATSAAGSAEAAAEAAKVARESVATAVEAASTAVSEAAVAKTTAETAAAEAERAVTDAGLAASEASTAKTAAATAVTAAERAVSDSATAKTAATQAAADAEAVKAAGLANDAGVAGLLKTGALSNAALSQSVSAATAQQVPPLVAKAIAADGTVAAAAGAAVTTAIAGRDLVEASDPRIPAMEDPAAFYIRNQDGGVPFRIENDSTFVGNTEIIPDDDHFIITGLNGKRIFDVDPVSGKVYIPYLETDTPSAPSGGTAATRVVFLIGAGQSNMAGRGLPFGPNQDFPDPRIRMWSWADKALKTATVPISGPASSNIGYGPLDEIAKQVIAKEPVGTVVVMLNAAVGNTTLVGESPSGTWPIDYAGEVPHLYEQMVNEIPKALTAIQAEYNLVPDVRFYWHQGEADAGATAAYTTKFTAIVNDLRSRLGLPNMPVVLGGMVPEYILANPNRAAIRAAHVQIPSTVARSAYADGISNGGGNSSTGDIVHYHRSGVEALGQAMYNATWRAVANKAGSVPVPPLKVAAALTGGQLTVTWEPPACAVTNYVAEYSIDAGSTWITIARPLALDTRASTAVAGGATLVRVATANASGISAPTTPIAALKGD